MVTVFDSIMVDRGFEPKDYKIGISYFAATYTDALRRKSKELLSRYQDNMSEWIDMSTRGLFFFQ